ncbi:MAG: glycerol-3-phosphate 1-O-acyltransferase PlsY [Acetobacteraceae bacterium]|nr:glycerol-3-phosphate 1-O-acyltransferase PlsY [Acetobacteraceae bacterium]
MIAAVLLGFVLGSIPFGLLLTRAAGLGDIRKTGSGNIGATNVLRTGRKDIAAATLLLDGGKGAVAVLIAAAWAGQPGALLAGVAAVLGHCFSPWVGFKGGKGVATGAGTLLAWSWPAGLLCLAIWIAAAFGSKRSSVGALAALTAAPVLLWLLTDRTTALAGLVVSAVCIARHHANIARLLAGTEPRIGQKR